MMSMRSSDLDEKWHSLLERLAKDASEMPTSREHTGAPSCGRRRSDKARKVRLSFAIDRAIVPL